MKTLHGLVAAGSLVLLSACGSLPAVLPADSFDQGRVEIFSPCAKDGDSGKPECVTPCVYKAEKDLASDEVACPLPVRKM